MRLFREMEDGPAGGRPEACRGGGRRKDGGDNCITTGGFQPCHVEELGPYP